jgi:uncharacterized RDD family membrane protein YckC
MKRIRIALVALLLGAVTGPSTAAAQGQAIQLDQTTQPPRMIPRPEVPERGVPLRPELPGPERPTSTDNIVEGPFYSYNRPVFRLGQDYRLPPSESVRGATVIYGNATIEGRVERDVVVVFGRADLSSTASINGSLVVVAGSASVAEGAYVRRDVTIVGGELDAPAGFSPGGEYIVVGSRILGGRLEAVVPWVTRGLLWGRPIVPNLPWVWGVAATFFLAYLALNLVFHKAIRTCAETLAQRPLTAFLVGLLVLLLTGPVSALLAVSVIGIPVVPVVLCAVFVAGLLGRVGVIRWIGMTAVPEDPPDSQLQSLRSFALGAAVILVAYMVPVLGFATFAAIGVLGLGAASLAFISGYRRENPLPPKPIPAAPPLPIGGTSVEPAQFVVPAANAYQAATPSVPSPLYSAQSAGGSQSSGEVMSSADSFATNPSGGSVPTAVLTSDLLAFPHAAFLDRLAAFVLDVILVLITAQFLEVWPFRFGDGNGIPLLMLAYHIGFWTWKGTTVGGIICQLRVVRVDGTSLRFVDALVRGLSAIFSLAVLGLGGLWILRDPERQAWHDRIAGTYVVKVPRNWPI